MSVKRKKRGYRGPRTREPLPRNDAHSRITPEEAERAIYIDFEKTVKGPLALIGIQVDTNPAQVVLDPRLAAAAKASSLRLIEPRRALEDLIRWAESDGRRLVGYTQFERQEIHAALGEDMSRLYADARMIGLRWKRACRRGEKLEDRSLKSFLKLIGYPRRAYLGAYNSAKWIRVVTEALEKRERFEDLTAVQKSFWTKLLEHNKVDCDGMRELVCIAAADLASRD